MVMARPATMLMVFALPKLVMSAFCTISLDASRLKCPLLRVISASILTLAFVPAAFNNIFPLVTLMPRVPTSMSPSLTRIDPAVVCSTRLPVTTRSDWAGSVMLVNVLPLPPTRLTARTAVWPISISVASPMYIPLPRTLALILATSVSTAFAVVPTAAAVSRRSSLA